MGTIAANTTITDPTAYTWPLTINAGITVTIGANLTITALNQYFIIGGSNVTITGQNYIITISSLTGYSGLVQNTNSTYLNVVINNLSVISSSSTILDGEGWICQSNFYNGIVSFCSSNGVIPTNGGGIFGTASCNSSATNCFSTGSIGLYAGGIFGSYCVNCTVNQSYSNGTIASYAGGIFGFGTNYTFDSSIYSPVQPIDQSGNTINPATIDTSACIVVLSTTINSYSTGSIGSYAGGIYGYFAYNSKATNSYTLGNGAVMSGGIFAPNFYFTSSIYTPTSTNCSTNNCYTTGSSLATNGIFAYSGNNISSNTQTCCFSEQYGVYNPCNPNPCIPNPCNPNPCNPNPHYNPCNPNPHYNHCNPCKPYNPCKSYNPCKPYPNLCGTYWKDCNANKILLGVGSIWIDIDICSENVPYLLGSFARELYTPNSITICYKYGNSNSGNFGTSYQIISVNSKKNKHISVNLINGILSFCKLKCGTYIIKVVNGTKFNLPTGNCANYYTYSNYNISNYYVQSLYKQLYCKVKKCNKKNKCHYNSSSSSSC